MLKFSVYLNRRVFIMSGSTMFAQVSVLVCRIERVENISSSSAVSSLNIFSGMLDKL